MRYLFATDGSRHAATALDYLLGVARPGRDRLHVIAVPVYLLAGSPEVSSPPIAAAMRRIRAKTQSIAEAAAERCRARGFTTTVSVAEGERAGQILAAAAAFRADVVVMGGGGLKGLRGALLGSTAAAVLSRARLPLLLVKGKVVPTRRVLLVRRPESRSAGAAPLRRLLPFDKGVAITSIPATDARVVDRAALWNAPDLIAFEEPAAPGSAAAAVARTADRPVAVGMRPRPSPARAARPRSNARGSVSTGGRHEH